MFETVVHVVCVGGWWTVVVAHLALRKLWSIAEVKKVCRICLKPMVTCIVTTRGLLVGFIREDG